MRVWWRRRRAVWQGYLWCLLEIGVLSSLAGSMSVLVWASDHGICGKHVLFCGVYCPLGNEVSTY